MRLTAQQEYGLRCMVQLARTQSADCVNIVDIADREGLSVAYVAKLLRVLRKAGLVRSTRGVKGGYHLTKVPEEINAYEVLDALGGKLYANDFCRKHSGQARACVHVVDCGSRAMLIGLDRMIQTYLKQFKLSDLLCPEKEVREVASGHVEQLPNLLELVPRCSVGSGS